MDIREKEQLIEGIQKANAEIKTMPIRGKEYAGVNERVMAFRRVYPAGRIHTQCVQDENGRAVFVATIYDDDGRMLSTGTAYETQNSSYINKTSYVENAETSAVGRALGFAGFGIVASIASADEVVSAQEQQTAGEKIDKNEAEVLRGLLKNETNIKLILDLFGVESLEDLTREQYAEAVTRYKAAIAKKAAKK